MSFSDFISYSDCSRVISIDANRIHVLTPEGDTLSCLPPRQDPVFVGDWVRLKDGALAEVMPRTGVIARKNQTMAVHVDEVLVVMAYGGDFNPNRLERWMSQLSSLDVQVTLVLNKLDQEPRFFGLEESIRAHAPEKIQIVSTSVLLGVGLDTLRASFAPGRTLLLVGASGVGKSSLLNALSGHHLAEVRAVSAHRDRGSHTTTKRTLHVLPNGAHLIDIPGVRSVLLTEEADTEETFSDIHRLLANCRWHNCSHETEPGCAIQNALASGELEERRWGNFCRIEAEIERQKLMEQYRDEGKSKGAMNSALKDKWTKNLQKHRRQMDKKDMALHQQEVANWQKTRG